MSTVLEERLVAPPDASLLFMSRRSDLRLVKVPIYPRYGAGGQKVGEERGQAVAFRDGVLRVPRDGKLTLEDGRTVDAQEVAEWLAEHRLNGNSEEGFWKVDPVAPPVSREEQERLVDAALALDDEMLQEIIDQERAGWNRADIIEVAQGGIEKIRAVKAEAERRAAEAAQPAKPGPKPKASQE